MLSTQNFQFHLKTQTPAGIPVSLSLWWLDKDTWSLRSGSFGFPSVWWTIKEQRKRSMVSWPYQNVKWNYRKKRSTTESFIKKLQWLEGKKYHWTKDLTTFTFFKLKCSFCFYTQFTWPWGYITMILHSPQIDSNKHSVEYDIKENSRIFDNLCCQ